MLCSLRGVGYQGLVKATIAAGDRIFATLRACLGETIPQRVGAALEMVRLGGDGVASPVGSL